MSRPSPTPAPALDGGVLLEEILEEILLRLPPQPSSLPRASLVCTRWRRILSQPGFLRRFREHHHRNKPPPLLGFFDHEYVNDDPPIFNPTMGQPDRIPPTRFSSPWSRGEDWDFLGCRHGLALLICLARREAGVWDPLAGHQRRVAFPPGFSEERGNFFRSAAVMCAQDQDGHVHGDCRFAPFRLALVGSDSTNDLSCTRQFGCLYESESGVWGNIVSVGCLSTHSIYPAKPGVLVSGSFCWLMHPGNILEFDCQRQSLAVTQKPAASPDWQYFRYLLQTEDGGLGLADLQSLSRIIRVWERKSNRDGVVGWELQKTIELDVRFSPGPSSGGTNKDLRMRGYDEDNNAVFLSTFSGDYMLQLDSTHYINLIETRTSRPYSRTCHPYRSFYIPGSGVGGADM